MPGAGVAASSRLRKRLALGMQSDRMTRVLDAWCEKCGEVRKHDVMDPGSCKCQICGSVQVLMKPLAPGQSD